MDRLTDTIMRKSYLLFLVLCCISNCVLAQGNLLRDISKMSSGEDAFEKREYSRDGGKKIRETPKTTISNDDTNINSWILKLGTNTSTSIKRGEIVSYDFVLFRDVVRKYTWMEGLGTPITQEEADHLPYYYRLSMKNDAGHYQMVEAMHGSSLTSSHPQSPYILDKENDVSGRNKEWRDRLLTIGQWIFYSDLSGKNVVEERAYEAKSKDAKLVYSMQPVRNDSNHVTIAYTDSYGYPADMNEDDRFTYGSVVYITYDKHGCDSIIDFLDGEGYRKPNTNGVDQTRCVYDEKCRPVLITSNNCVGDYAMDNWGNCGVKYVYDDKNNTYSMICVDSNLQPMRMPSTRAGKDNTYIRRDIRKDKWGRKVEETMLTVEGEKDATLSGIHRITYSYTSDGRMNETKYFDKEGNLLTIE